MFSRYSILNQSKDVSYLDDEKLETRPRAEPSRTGFGNLVTATAYLL